MARFYGTTEQRGLGSAHRADRERLLALHKDGDLCWRCGQPMYKSQNLERDHVIDRALGGADGPAVLAHMACNRAAGARLGNQMQPRVILGAGHDILCRTCGKPYHYAARSCEVCGVHYHPSGKAVRTCSRTCGMELRRQVYGPTGRCAPKPKPACEMCGEPCKAAGKRFCSGACAKDAELVGSTGLHSVIAYYNCRYCGKLGINKSATVKGHGMREVCPDRNCQLARLAANNLVARKGMTREQADAVVVAYRAEGDHRQLHGSLQSSHRQASRGRPSRTVTAEGQAALW